MADASPSKLIDARIDLREGEKIDEEAFKTLIRAAVALNQSKVKKKR